MKHMRGAAALAGAATLLLAACGSSSSTTTSSSPAAGGGTTSGSVSMSETGSATGSATSPAETSSTTMPGSGTTITIWADDLRVAALKEQAASFKEQTGIDVKLQVVANEKLREQFKNSVGAGEGPDIVVGAHDWIGELAQGNVIAPIQMDEMTQGKFSPESIAAAKFDGQIYGVPYAVESLALIRNTDLAPEAPATMEDLVKSGQALVAAKKAERVMAQEIGKDGNAYNIYPYLAAYGGGIFKNDNGSFDGSTLVLNSPETVKGAEKLAWLGKEKALSPNIDGSNAIPLFVAKKTPYLISGPWAIEQVTKAKINYSIEHIPGFADGGKSSPFLGVQVFMVNAKSPNLAVAQTFVQEFVSTPEVQVALFEAGDRPPALVEAYDQVSASNEDIAAWGKAAAGGTPMPNIPQMNSVWAPLGKAGNDIINGKAPAARLEQVQKDIEAAIAKG